MKISAEFKRSAFAVPGSVLEHLRDADSLELSVLLYALAKGDFNLTDAAEELGTDESEFMSAVAVWEARGVLVIERRGTKKSRASKSSTATDSPKKERAKEPPKKQTDSTVKKSSRRTSQLPGYTMEESAAFLEQNKASAEIIDSCENIIGKIFTTAETNIVIGMLDHLALSGDYILLLFAHAASIGKNSVRYIERLAISFFDRGITEYAELEQELAAIKRASELETRVRAIFGLGRRALTSKEEKFIRSWSTKLCYGEDIIRRAYEITVNNTNEPSMDYANAVLENWYKANLKTLEEVDASLAARSAERKKESEDSSSFDTDDFFEAALKRSYNS